RKDRPALVYGAYQMVWPAHEQLYAYTRTLGDEQLLVVLNFSDTAVTVELPDDLSPKTVLIDNYEADPVNGGQLSLQPYQSVIYELD
ncbi:MAG: alpha-glucosidase C-terminal domain-containing protein, partial [Lewinella sp.]|nr:alpha-glucosidase C-terminal domain-containing protein [Lewinella sp.]